MNDAANDSQYIAFSCTIKQGHSSSTAVVKRRGRYFIVFGSRDFMDFADKREALYHAGLEEGQGIQCAA